MWAAYRDRNTGRVYYANQDTRESSWSAPPPGQPCIPYPAEDLLAHWKAYRSLRHGNELFFLNDLSGEKSWERPFKFYGMPEGEEEEHDAGPFVQYVDADDRLYFYNPITKLVTRNRPAPAKIVSEEEAYEELRRKGMLWERPVQEDKLITKEVLKHDVEEEEVAERRSSSGSDLSESSEDVDDEVRRPFFQLLEEKGVTKFSKWSNWLPSLNQETVFTDSPPEKRREWFEAFVRDLVMKDSAKKATAIREIKLVVRRWIEDNPRVKRNFRSLLNVESLPDHVKVAMEGLRPDERQILVAAFERKYN